jgi:integrase
VGKIKVRYLVEKPRRRGPAFYWQPTEKLVAAGFLVRRLSDSPAAAIKEAEDLNDGLDRWYAGQPAEALAPEGSLKALRRLYESPENEAFNALKPRTQRDHKYYAAIVEAWVGDIPIAEITRKSVKTWLREMKNKRGANVARHCAATLSKLLSVAEDEGWIDIHPARKLRIKAPKPRARMWTDNERVTFCRQAEKEGRRSIALAVMLAWCTGQRPGDILTMPRSADRGRHIALTQAKTAKEMLIPILPDLRQAIDAAPKAAAVQIVVSEVTGRAYQESDFQHWFAWIREQAELPKDLHFADLRRTVATALGRAGCTDDEIRAITGHKTRGVVSVYVLPDDRFAKTAMGKLKRSRARDKVGRIQLAAAK